MIEKNELPKNIWKNPFRNNISNYHEAHANKPPKKLLLLKLSKQRAKNRAFIRSPVQDVYFIGLLKGMIDYNE